MTAISTQDPVVNPVPVNLTLQDLHLCSEIIQVVSGRGAIKPEEMEAVGTLFTKLVTFLKQSGAYNPPTEPVAPQSVQSPESDSHSVVETMPTTIVEEQPVGSASAAEPVK